MNTKTNKTNKTKPIHTSHWTVKNARGIRATNGNTFPAFDPDKLKQLMPGYQTWDNGLVLDEDGFIADVGGFRVIWALVRPVGADFSEGERIAYFYSADGEHYVPGGFLFGDHKLYDDVREWSGSIVLRDDGKLQTYYTVAYGAEIEGVWQTVQRLATAIQDVTVEGDKLTIEAPTYHALLGGVCEPDGYLYETPAQASEREAKWPTRHRVSVGSDQTENDCMRDPFFYKDKRTGKRYLAFEANTGAGFHAPGHVRAEYVSANEIERINVVDHDGHVYLFCVGHGNKNTLDMENADMINRDYMLGFRAPYFGGPLTPLNGSGVIVQQKSLGDAYAGQKANQQYVYSWLITPHRDQKLGVFPCVSYANYCDTGKGVEAVMNAGPSVRIEIDGLKTRIVGMMYDIQPAQVDASREADKGSATEHGYA